MNVYAEVQKACEERLEAAELAMDADWSEDSAIDWELAAQELSGPYDGCHTCIIREVLDAARPYFARLAAEEGQIKP